MTSAPLASPAPTRVHRGLVRVLALAAATASLSTVATVTTAPAAEAATGVCWGRGDLSGPTYVVPEGVTGVRVTVSASSGWGWGSYNYATKSGNYQRGGAGSVLTADFPTTVGQRIRQGTLAGAAGGRSHYAGDDYRGNTQWWTMSDAGDGGGTQLVYVDGDCRRLLAIAGGGGGAGTMSGGGRGGDAGAGGDDGGDNNSKDGAGGGGATTTSGGAGGARGAYGASACHDGARGEGGSMGFGGSGGEGPTGIFRNDELGRVCDGGGGAGGGGAGYYMGGGGGSAFNNHAPGGGGGGSSYADPAGTVVESRLNDTYYPQPTLVTPISNTTTTLTSSLNPSQVGDPVVLTAKVARVIGGVPEMGTVTFYDGNIPLGTTDVASGVATLSTSTFSRGTHELQAHYNGGGNQGQVNNPSWTTSTNVGGLMRQYLQRVDPQPVVPPTVPDAAPVLTRQPEDQASSYGASCAAEEQICNKNSYFFASVTGSPTPTFQWQVSAPGSSTFADVPGAAGTPDSIGAILHTFAGTVAQTGSRYRVVVSNRAGTATSQAARLTVTKAPLVVRANDVTVLAGTTLPTLGVTYGRQGANPALSKVFRNRDTADSLGGTLACTTTATTNSLPGTYPITCGGQTSSNYDLTYEPATLTVATNSQQITVTQPAFAQVAGTSFTLDATGGRSGQPVTYSLDPSTRSGACTLDGSTVKLGYAWRITGQCVVDIDQAGTPLFTAAPQVQVRVAADYATQVVTTQVPASATVGTTVVPDVTSSSGAGWSPEQVLAGSCTFLGNAVRLTGLGECRFTIRVAGDEVWASTMRTLTIQATSNTQTIDFPQPANGVAGTSAQLTATGGRSGSAVTFQVVGDPSTCSVTGSTVRYTAVGDCVVRSSQAAGGGYLDAWDVDRTIPVARGTQAISFSTAGTATSGTSTELRVTGGSSGNPITSAVAPASAETCSLDGTTLRFLRPGSCVVLADQAGTASYDAAPTARLEVTVVKPTQRVSFSSAAPSGARAETTVDVIVAGGDSGQAVVLTSVTPSVCTVAERRVSLLRAGTCTLAADQAGDDTYAPAAQALQSFTVLKAPAVLAFTTTAVDPRVGGTYDPAVSTTSTARVQWGSAGNGVCSVTTGSGRVSFTHPGTCFLSAYQDPTADDPFLLVQQLIVVRGALQTVRITSPAAASPVVGTRDDLTVTGGASGQPVVVGSTTPDTCTVTGLRVTFDHAGTCTVTATQAGDADREAASPVSRTYLVGRRSQAVRITSTPPSAPVVGDVVAVGVAGGPSGQPVELASTTPGTCTVTGLQVSLDHAGDCTVTASQAGDADHLDAAPDSRTWTVGRRTQDLRIASSAPAGLLPGSTHTVTTTSGGSTAAVALSVLPASAGRCSVAGLVVSFQHAGSCVVEATQAGDADHLDATPVRQQLDVARLSPTVSITSVVPAAAAAVVGATYDVTATGGGSSAPLVVSIDGSTPDGPCRVDAGDRVVLAHPGTCTIAVGQAGDDDHDPASATQTVTVHRASTTTTASVRADSLHATVAVSAPGAGAPGGSVRFSRAGEVLGTAVVRGGTAVLPGALPTGVRHDVTATYLGDVDLAGSAGSVTRTDPTLTATVTPGVPSSGRWYRTPVVVTFACTATSAALTGACPAPVLLADDGADQRVTRGVDAEDGGGATLTTAGISIDQTAPEVEVELRDDGTARCRTTDALSGVASCVLSIRHADGVTTYRAEADDAAGNTATRTLTVPDAPAAPFVSPPAPVIGPLVGHAVGTAADRARDGMVHVRSARLRGSTWQLRPGRDALVVVTGTDDRPSLAWPREPGAGIGTFVRAGRDRWLLRVASELVVRRTVRLEVRFGDDTEVVSIRQREDA